MKRLVLFLCALALPLTACATVPSTAPATYAQLTKADEQAAVTAELGYKAWRLAIEIGVKAGYIKGSLAGKVADTDADLYTGLQAVENAYAAGNATSLADALIHFNNSLKQANMIMGSK